MLKMIIACLGAVLFSSCVLPNSAASPTQSKQPSVVFTVNGTAVTMDELIKSPEIRDGLEQILLIHSLKSMVAVQGITIDQAVLEERMDNMRDQAVQNGSTFEELLQQQGTNEPDFKETLRIGLLWEGLLESYFEIKDEALEAMWDENPDRFKNIHARENSLTDNEKDQLTWTDVYDTLLETYKNEEFARIAPEVQQAIVDSINLNINCISDSKERKFFEDLIINKKKSTYVEPAVIVPDPETEAGDSLPDVVHDDEHPTVVVEGENPCGSAETQDDVESGEEVSPEDE